MSHGVDEDEVVGRVFVKRNQEYGNGFSTYLADNVIIVDNK
ncbi:MAG: hypothetical protein H6Q74_290 [Firmicutes bacterium]|nr:hypothetical protein [Bacillota bacterium]